VLPGGFHDRLFILWRVIVGVLYVVSADTTETLELPIFWFSIGLSLAMSAT
jgi:hypothetical protein